MQKVAGLFFFLAGCVILLGILTAEIFYSTNYSISLNRISNLGSTPPPHSIIRQPSAAIFDTSLIISGIMILMGAYFLYQSLKKKLLIIALSVLGIGCFGVGVLPAYHAAIHPLIALIAFLGGGISAIVSSKNTTSPFSWLALCLGMISLLLLFLGVVMPHTVVPYLGAGGTERWIMYPVLLWLTGFGGYLMSQAEQRKK